MKLFLLLRVNRCIRWSICLSLLLSFSCTSSSKKNPPPTTHLLRISLSRDPLTLDPRKGGDFISAQLHFLLYEGLVRLNPDGTTTPAQAQEVLISEDKTTYTFHLRETYWSDGTAVTAHDFERSWKEILSPHFPAPNAHLLYPIQNAELAKKGIVSSDCIGIKALNDRTFIVHLNHPTPYFLNLISFATFFPFPEKEAKGPSLPLSNGPFQLLHWKQNYEIICAKNPLYWENTRVQLDQVQMSIVANENTSMKMYEQEELDLIGLGYSSLPRGSLDQYREQLRTLHMPGSSLLYFHVNKFPLNNKKIRYAFSLAIDKQEIVDNISHLGEEIGSSLIPPALREYPAENPQPNPIEHAQIFFHQGLEELGISPDQFPTLLYRYTYSELNQILAQILQQQLQKNLGVRLFLQASDHATLLRDLHNRYFDIAQTYWIAHYNDPMCFLERFRSPTHEKNYSHWKNPLYTALLKKSWLTPTSEKRQELLQQAELLLLEEAPIVTLYHLKMSFIMKAHLLHPEIGPKGIFDISHLQYR